MRRATLIVAVAALLLSFVPFVSTAPRALLLTLAAIAMTAAAFRDYGRVAAMATLVAFTSSAVVLIGGLTAARPAAGSLPTAGVLWWWPLAVGGLLTARLSFELQSHSRDAGRWLAAFMLATFGAWGLQGRAAERRARARAGAPVRAGGPGDRRVHRPAGSLDVARPGLPRVAGCDGRLAGVDRARDPDRAADCRAARRDEHASSLFVDALSDDDVTERTQAAPPGLA